MDLDFVVVLQKKLAPYKYDIKKYGEKVYTEDHTLEMSLDVKQGTLKYVINGKDYGIAFDYVYESKYRLAVTLSGRADGTIVQLY